MKKIFNTKEAPRPVGPYNQAVLANGMLFISGQIAIDPANGELVTGDIESETHRVLKNIGALLQQADMSYDDVVKCSVFVSDMDNYSRINAVYAQYFSEENAPARELVEVSNLPKYVHVEISAIAVKS